MVPGDKIKHLEKIEHLNSSKFIINLEDGVFDKDFARNLVYEKLINSKIKNKIVVRVNSLDTCGIEDIKIINKINPFAIRVPKIQSVDDVEMALKLINKDIEVHLSIETSMALNNLSSFGIDKRVTSVYLGILDLLESLKLPQHLLKRDNPSIDYILSKFLIDSKIANLNPISFMYQEYKNIDEFTLWCKKLKNMGYSSKACLSPKQVEIVNEIFQYSNEDIIKAKYIVEIFEKNLKNNICGFADIKYGFIDEPIYKDSKLILNNI